MTEAEYLELERHAEFKSEYFRGEMVAMAGAGPRHAFIVTNLVMTLGQQLKQRPCRVGSSDLRLRITPAGLYTYPDVVVICGNVQLAEDQKDTVLNPTLIIEVLSDSTRDYDRGRKFQHYRTLASVAEYLTVEQDSAHVERWARQPDNHWLLSEFDALDQTIELTSIGCVLPMAEIYDKVDFSAE